MRRRLMLLSLLLVLQLGLALGLHLESRSLAAFKGTENFLKVTPNVPDRLVFSGAEGTKITLQKKAGSWTLPNHFGAAADSRKIDALLKTLQNIRRPWPVARHGDVETRFKVAADKFERRLSFIQGDKTLATLLLGSSPGFRKVHARLAGEQNIYDIPFSTYQVSLKPEDWIDKQALELKANQIRRIDLADFHLVRKDGKLQLEALAKGEQTDQQKAEALVRKLAHLSILDVVGKTDPSLDKSALLSINLTLKDGKKRDYWLLSGAKKGELRLQVSDQPYRYRVSPGLKAELQGYTRAQLIKTSVSKAQQKTPVVSPPQAG